MNVQKDEFGIPTGKPPVPTRRRGVVGPVILIAMGLVFLANNLGLLGWEVWSVLWRLWPVWLIAGGLDILFGRNTAWGRWVILGVVLTFLGGALYLYPTLSAGGSSVAEDQIAADVNGAKAARVEIKPGVGELRISAGAQGGRLVDGEVYRINGSRLVKDHYNSGDTAVYSLRTEMNNFPLFFGNNTRGGRWDLRLNPDVPTQLTVGTGVGESTLDLSALTLTGLKLETGVGESNITLPAKGEFRAEINTGVGATTINIPRSMAVRIRFSTGIGSVNVGGDYDKRDGVWISPSYDTAKDRVELQVSGGIGEIRVRQVSN